MTKPRDIEIHTQSKKRGHERGKRTERLEACRRVGQRMIEIVKATSAAVEVEIAAAHSHRKKALGNNTDTLIYGPIPL